MRCTDPIQDLLPWHVKDMLETQERKRVEKHLLECAVCRNHQAAYRQFIQALMSRRPEGTPPSADTLLARLSHPIHRDRLSIADLKAKANHCWPWLLLCSQERVVRREIWTASALVMILGVLVTFAVHGPHSSISGLPFVLLSPIIAAIGVAFLYGSAVDPALEIELATPTSTRLILLARLSLIFGFDLGMGLIGSVALAGLLPEISLWPLVMTWLAPMAFLSALAFLLTVLSSNPGIAVLVSLVLWAVQNLTRMIPISWNLPNLTSPEARPWLWTLATIFAGLALWLGEDNERWLREDA
jgi:hypothetical protein